MLHESNKVQRKTSPIACVGVAGEMKSQQSSDVLNTTRDNVESFRLKSEEWTVLSKWVDSRFHMHCVGVLLKGCEKLWMLPLWVVG
jgi:hypothetical protein